MTSSSAAGSARSFLLLVVVGMPLLLQLASPCEGRVLGRPRPQHVPVVASEDGVDATGSNSSFDPAYTLPEGFRFGAASSAYQIEGAWNASGKGPSVFDHLFHTSHTNQANGDVSADSYHRWREDVAMLKLMKLDTYRFSLAWSRILPTGEPDNVNLDGVRFYQDLIDELLRNGIEPLITLYHFDYPQALEDKFGGWQNQQMVDYFEKYARVVFQHLGEKVKFWTSLNQPHINCMLAYGRGMLAPAVLKPGVGEYTCGHHMILAHAAAYRVYKDEFSHLTGQFGITLESYFARPVSNSYEDVAAAERYNVFEFAWFADPLLRGDYPELMRKRIANKSRADGESASRLPAFTVEEKAAINGTLDFLGINVYYGFFATDGLAAGAHEPSLESDMGVATFDENGNPLWVGEVDQHERVEMPWSIRYSLLWIRDRYDNFPVFITENGYGGVESEGTDDQDRVAFHTSYLQSMLYAVNVDKCNVIGYTAWSLLDSFEWSTYSKKMGLVHVDYTSPNRTRTPKKSAAFFRQVMTDRAVPAPTASSKTASLVPGLLSVASIALLVSVAA